MDVQYMMEHVFTLDLYIFAYMLQGILKIEQAV